MTTVELHETIDTVYEALGRRAWSRSEAARKGSPFKKNYAEVRHDFLVSYVLDWMALGNMDPKKDVKLPPQINIDQFNQFISTVKLQYNV